MTIYRFHLLFISLITLFTGACTTTTSLTGVWFDKQYSGPPLQNIMIIAVTENTRNRRIFEDALVKQFSQAGTKATASYTVFPGVEQLNKDLIAEKSASLKLDGIIITTITAIENEELYYPPASTYVAPQPYYHNMWTYYPQVYETNTSPGYTVKYEHVKLESNLYNPDTEKLIWSAQSQLFDPKSQDLNTVSESLAWKFIQSLRKAKLLKQK
ncbi:hypothetical protein MNBD_GAMMA25-2115 [hydrothermal vent metagenome]|uniref:DUF4136 domain-containing protein n=1 Tax=hydrothermal vent metagenome TaxID=652676 RepID=A0A3B1B665_9ZZZZ